MRKALLRLLRRKRQRLEKTMKNKPRSRTSFDLGVLSMLDYMVNLLKKHEVDRELILKITDDEALDSIKQFLEDRYNGRINLGVLTRGEKMSMLREYADQVYFHGVQGGELPERMAVRRVINVLTSDEKIRAEFEIV